MSGYVGEQLGSIGALVGQEPPEPHRFENPAPKLVTHLAGAQAILHSLNTVQTLK